MKQINWKTFVIEWLFFVATLGLGIFIAPRILSVLESNVVHAAEGTTPEGISPVGFLIYFVVATLVVYLVSKSKKLKESRLTFFKLAFFFSTGLGGFITLSVFILEPLALLVIIFALIVWQKRPIILLHNLLIVISIAGVGAIIGPMFKPFMIVLFLVLFSIYDVIAVYKTKHMVKMATEMIKTRAIIGLIAPFQFQGLLESLSEKKKKDFMVLGGGDLAFPLFLTTSVSVNFGLKEALIILVFASLGLLASFLFFIFQRTKKPIPALPPIALFSVIGYFIVYWIG